MLILKIAAFLYILGVIKKIIKWIPEHQQKLEDESLENTIRQNAIYARMKEKEKISSVSIPE